MLTILFLFLAWILTFFGVDGFVIDFFKEIFGMTITRSTYYVIFLIVGLFLDIKSYFSRW